MNGERFTWRDIKKQFRVVLAIIFFSLIFIGIFSAIPHPSFTSSEVKFTDASPSGLAIVPASCPSPPFTEDFPGECGTNAPTCADGTPAPNGDQAQCPGGGPGGPGGGGGGGCKIGYTSQNGSCVFTGCPLWYTQQGNQCVILGCPGGYTLSGGQCVVTSCPSNYLLQDGQCVSITCPTGQSPQNGVCVTYGSCVVQNECLGQDLYSRAATCKATLIQTCPYGCANSACVIPPPSIAQWQVLPTLVRSGSTAHITWTAQNVSSCTITGSNGDSWTGATGDEISSPLITQTIFTITCQGLAGASLASISDSTTVNIVPVFQEK